MSDEVITIRVVNLEREEVVTMFKIRKSMPLKKVFKAYKSRIENGDGRIDVDAFHFKFNGKRIPEEATAQQIHLEHDDQIDCYLPTIEELAKLSIYINFIDEDGEVLKLQTKPGELTNQVFDRYALQQGTPFLLSGGMYDFVYNGKAVPVGATFESMGIAAGDDKAVIYVTKVPSQTDFNNRIVPNIPAFVKNQPRYFIDQKVVFRTNIGSVTGTVTYYDGDTSSFIIESNDDKTKQYDIDKFINLIQDYYSDLNGFTLDIRRYLLGLVSNYESQVEQLDTDQGLDEPNAIILRMIKIRQQIYRLLSFINVVVTSKEERKEIEISMLNQYTRRLGKVLSSLSDKKKSHLSNTSLHKVNKPLLELEEVVRVKYWPNNNKNLEPSWEKGTIRSYTEHEDIDGYGPRRVYSVEFNNGECRSDVEDYQLIPEENYVNGSDLERMGIHRAVDKDSSDPWARAVGWCTTEIEGVEEAFVYMSDVIKAVNCRRAIAAYPQETYLVYQKQTELGMLQAIDRLSDPLTRQIGRLLIRQIHAEYVDAWEMETSGVLWKMALGHYNDGNTKQMRDSVLRFAISRQCYGLGFSTSNEKMNFLEHLYNFFICSEGCLDTFLFKVPIFREGYDSTVPSEHTNEKDLLPGRQSDPEVMMTYLKKNKPKDIYRFMNVRFVCDNETRYSVECDAPFKDLLTRYATDMNTSTKLMRVKYNGKLLFLSSIGKKTLVELGIEDDDILEVTIISTPSEPTTVEQPKQQSKGKNKNTKKKKHKKSKKKQPVQIAPPEDEEEKARKKWMFSLYSVFGEAEPTFKEIRQRLNALSLERTKPKQRTIQSKTTEPVVVVDNPLGDNQPFGGKAGKTQFIIQVGEVSNLYKTTKSTSSGHGRRQDDTLIDLHGLTAEEAVYRLDKHLPDWIESAMKGTYPFVIPVKIVCGGGSQVLAEVVENWIKQNDHVANAPKNMYS